MDKKDLKEYLVKETGNYTESEVDDMSNKELLDAYLTWNGLLGWTDNIIQVVEAAFDVELDDVTM